MMVLAAGGARAPALGSRRGKLGSVEDNFYCVVEGVNTGVFSTAVMILWQRSFQFYCNHAPLFPPTSYSTATPSGFLLKLSSRFMFCSPTPPHEIQVAFLSFFLFSFFLAIPEDSNREANGGHYLLRFCLRASSKRNLAAAIRSLSGGQSRTSAGSARIRAAGSK